MLNWRWIVQHADAGTGITLRSKPLIRGCGMSGPAQPLAQTVLSTRLALAALADRAADAADCASADVVEGIDGGDVGLTVGRGEAGVEGPLLVAVGVDRWPTVGMGSPG
jgi:hypothetical protein